MSQPRRQDLLDDLVRFYRNYYRDEIGELAQKYPRDQQSLWIDWTDIHRFEPDIATDTRNEPDEMVDYFQEALGQYDLPVDVDLSDAHVRLHNLPPTDSHAVGGYRSDDIGRLIAVEGQVSKRTKVRPKPVSAAYECERCGTITRIPQGDQGIQEPHECQGCERQGPFNLNRRQSEWRDHQLIRVQQPPEEATDGDGVHVDVHIEDDLVELVETGDRVTVNGVMGLEEPDNDSIAFDPYIDGNSIEVEETDYEDIDIEEYREEIVAIANGEYGDPYDLIVNSIAPKVHGMDTIKLALALQLFGGVRVEYPHGSTERGNSHILLLGDPGTAKSTLLRAVEDIAPRAAFASGKGASSAGMTAAAVADDFGDTKWSLEAGALVIANNGIACVDEIDKVREDAVNSMHEALEDERVNINKAGINTTLPAKTALLAAGNPKYGRFDQYEPIAEQIDLDPALMSRFDLMYMVDDEPDRDEDPEIIGSILENHQTGVAYTADPDAVSDDDIDEVTPAIPREAMRAYIALAKKESVPQMPDHIKNDLKHWFAELRHKNGDEEDAPIPVTFRKLEGVVRLAEASARVRLNDTIDEEDLQRAKDLVMRSMEDVGMDPESGELDADIVETGMSKSQRDRIKNLKTLIQDMQDDYDAGVPEEDLINKALELGMGKNNSLHEIEKLKQKGEIFEPKTDHFRTT